MTAVAAVSVVSGCGQSDEDQIRSVFADLQRATQGRDYRALCSMTTTDAQEHVGQIGHAGSAGCVRDMRQIVTAVVERQAGAPPSRSRLTRVVVDGEQASAVVVHPGGIRTDVPFALEGGRWKVDALYGGVPGAEQRDKFRRLP